MSPYPASRDGGDLNYDQGCLKLGLESRGYVGHLPGNSNVWIPTPVNQDVSNPESWAGILKAVACVQVKLEPCLVNRGGWSPGLWAETVEAIVCEQGGLQPWLISSDI